MGLFCEPGRALQKQNHEAFDPPPRFRRPHPLCLHSGRKIASTSSSSSRSCPVLFSHPSFLAHIHAGGFFGPVVQQLWTPHKRDWTQLYHTAAFAGFVSLNSKTKTKQNINTPSVGFHPTFKSQLKIPAAGNSIIHVIIRVESGRFT